MDDFHLAFRTEFLEEISNRSGWPPLKDIRTWFREHHGGIRLASYKLLRQGKPQDRKYAVGFLGYLLHLDDHESVPRCVDVLDTFLTDRDMPGLKSMSLQEIVDAVCERFDVGPADDNDPTDHLLHGIARLSDYIRRGLGLDNCTAAVKNEAELDEAIRWMYAQTGYQLNPGKPDWTPDQAIAAAAQHMRVPVARYQERARAWWKFNPWTVVLARGKTGPVGVSIVLPINDTAYEEVLNGHRCSYDCTPAEFSVPAKHLLLEACHERPRSMGAENLNPTRRLLFALLNQWSAMWQATDNRQIWRLKVLSFAGTPKNRQRLMGNGFRPTGKRMKDADVEFMELRLRRNESIGLAVLMVALILFLTIYCSGDPPA